MPRNAQTRTALSMIPGANLAIPGHDIGEAAQSALNRQPTPTSRAADAQRAMDLRIARLRAQSAAATAAGNHADAADMDAFIEHLRSGAGGKGNKTAQMPAAAPRRRINPRVAAASNAFAGMGQ